jgi:hypothetical protein
VPPSNFAAVLISFGAAADGERGEADSAALPEFRSWRCGNSPIDACDGIGARRSAHGVALLFFADLVIR